MTKAVVSRFLFFVLFLQGVERDMFLSLVKASLEDTWKIDGPRAKIKMSATNIDNVVEEEKNSDSKILPCDTCRSSQAFQLEYSISNKVKLARYKVFQQDCNDEFEVGTELVQGTGDIVEKEGSGPFFTMNLSSNPLDDSQFASVELVPIIATSTTTETSALSYLMDLYSMVTAWFWGDDVAYTVRFCIRMGLFLPPEAGGMEVNFRETNVVVALREDLSVQHVELEARPMNPVTVHIAGAKLKSDTPIQKIDEENDSPEEPTKDEPNEKELSETVSDNTQESDEL